MTTTDKETTDWERIESDFRAGILSLREISAANPGTNHVNIARRAKKEGWTRDLSAKISAKAEEFVTRQSVTADVTKERTVTDRQIIDINAQAVADVKISHRAIISRARVLAEKLLIELETEKGKCRIDRLKKLSEAINVLTTVERKAWGIQDGQAGREEAADNLANRMETARKRALSGNG